MNERLMMEGKVIQLKRDQTALRYRMEGLCSLIREMLSTVLYAPEEVEVAMAASHMDELVMVQAELLTVLAQIRKLEAALGR